MPLMAGFSRWGAKKGMLQRLFKKFLKISLFSKKVTPEGIGGLNSLSCLPVTMICLSGSAFARLWIYSGSSFLVGAETK